MCGIDGILGEYEEDEIVRMNSALEHRGRDEDGTHFGDGFALGNRRLSIIDTSNAGKQPMSNEDGTVWVTFNGEIYNFRALKQELEAKGHKFRTKTDTEVIAHAYEEWGNNCVQRFNGMFAFGLYDAQQQKLILARDRVGIKPLYYTISDDKLVFASEAKAIVGNTARPNQAHFSLDTFFYNGEETYFEGVSELLPAHVLEAKLNHGSIHVRKQRYWTIPNQAVKSDEAEVVREMCPLLEESVRQKLTADVPIGVFLSGGLDSSLVTSLAIRDYPNLRAFCVGRPDFGRNELDKAQQVADYLDVPLEKVELSEDQIIRIIPKLIYHLEDPDPRNVELAVMNYFMSQRAADLGITVILSGEGADEIHGGYESRYFSGWNNCYELLQRWHSNHSKNKDRASMAVPVEIRAPFLDDTKLLEYSMSIDPTLKFRSNKYVLRQMARRYLPEWISEQKKGHGHLLSGVAFAVGGDLNKRYESYKDIFMQIFRDGAHYRDVSLSR